MWQEYSNFISSNIKSLWYNSATLQLIVEYVAGSKYTYENVNPIKWLELKNAQSKGKFIAENIRANPFKKMILNG